MSWSRSNDFGYMESGGFGPKFSFALTGSTTFFTPFTCFLWEVRGGEGEYVNAGKTEEEGGRCSMALRGRAEDGRGVEVDGGEIEERGTWVRGGMG